MGIERVELIEVPFHIGLLICQGGWWMSQMKGNKVGIGNTQGLSATPFHIISFVCSS